MTSTDAAAVPAPPPPSPPAPPAPGARPEVREPLIYGFGRCICRPWVDLWFDLKVYNVHHVPRRGGVLVVSNHQSYLDPVLRAVKVPRPFSFLAKSELFENPYFGWLIRSLNAFPVRQGEGDVGAVKETIRRLQEGHALILYPEGTRTHTGEIQKMQPGAGLIVRRAGVPVVPAVIEGSFDAWPPKRSKVFRPHPIRVLYGPPLELDGLKANQIVQKIDATLRGMLAELRRREPILARRKRRRE
jgi:1-acyl-sn-glycerol-3-phosphate acyltransferase